MLRPGSAVVEIGFNDYPSVLPTDFYCLARNLDFRYVASFHTVLSVITFQTMIVVIRWDVRIMGEFEAIQ